MRRFVFTALLAPALVAAPALAEPVVTSSMPAIEAKLSGDQLGVRLNQGVLGHGRGLQPRTVVIVAHDAAGRPVAEETARISRRMTYAQIPVSSAIAEASSVVVTVR